MRRENDDLFIKTHQSGILQGFGFGLCLAACWFLPLVMGGVVCFLWSNKILKNVILEAKKRRLIAEVIQ